MSRQRKGTPTGRPRNPEIEYLASLLGKDHAWGAVRGKKRLMDMLRVRQYGPMWHGAAGYWMLLMIRDLTRHFAAENEALRKPPEPAVDVERLMRLAEKCGPRKEVLSVRIRDTEMAG